MEAINANIFLGYGLDLGRREGLTKIINKMMRKSSNTAIMMPVLLESISTFQPWFLNLLGA